MSRGPTVAANRSRCELYGLCSD